MKASRSICLQKQNRIKNVPSQIGYNFYINLIFFYNERVEKTYESLVHRMNRLKSFPLTILE